MEEDISNKTGDISNKTIVVLVVLTVIISVLGTLVVLSEVSNVKLQAMQMAPRSSSSSGKVSLTILGEGEKAPSNSVSPAGYVTLEIRPK